MIGFMMEACLQLQAEQAARPGAADLQATINVRHAAVRAAATVVPTRDREGRSEAASAAAGAAGRKF